MKRTHVYLPETLAAVSILGTQIAARRRDLGWTAAQLAGRLGITAQLVSRIEKGSPSTAVGTVLEAAVVCGVPLFAPDAHTSADLDVLAERQRRDLTLLPARVRRTAIEVPNDF